VANPVKHNERGLNGRGSTQAVDIGARLASHRTSQGLRVSALAGLVGVSPSLISQIERGQSRPSVSTLFALSEALEVPVDAFFRGDQAPARPAAAGAPHTADVAGAGPAERRSDRYVVREADRDTIDIEGGVRWERLTPTSLADAEFLLLEYAPFAESNPTAYRHPGFEMVLTLSGRLEITVGLDTHELGSGDSICFPSTLPHRYVNPTSEPARAVTVILPDGASSGSTTNRRT
jgi:transcriptional regulator with XRE-family HTH domain